MCTRDETASGSDRLVIRVPTPWSTSWHDDVLADDRLIELVRHDHADPADPDPAVRILVHWRRRVRDSWGGSSRPTRWM